MNNWDMTAKQMDIDMIYRHFLTIMLFSPLSFAKGKFDYDLHELSLVNVANLGYGGYHAADITSFYSILQNPANTGLTGKKMIFPSLCLNASGNIDLIPDLPLMLLRLFFYY